MKGGQTREHSMFLEGDISRYTKSFGKRVSSTKTFMFGAIAKKATKAGPWFKFSAFMRMEKNKASTTKSFKVRVVGRSTI